jgi:GNAT superfamily N-acetyltransferase
MDLMSDKVTEKFTIQRALQGPHLEKIVDMVNRAYKKVPYVKDDRNRVTLEELDLMLQQDMRVYYYEDQANNHICGAIALEITDQKVEIGMVSVDPEYQGQNIGSLLLKHVEDVARIELKQKDIHLNVVPFLQEKLVVFYIRNGFKFTGESEKFSPQDLERYMKAEYWNQLLMLVMCKPL